MSRKELNTKILCFLPKSEIADNLSRILISVSPIAFAHGAPLGTIYVLFTFQLPRTVGDAWTIWMQEEFLNNPIMTSSL